MSFEQKEHQGERLVHEAEMFEQLIMHAFDQVNFQQYTHRELLGQFDALYKVGDLFSQYSEFCQQANQYKPAEHLFDLQAPFVDRVWLEDLYTRVQTWKQMDKNEKRIHATLGSGVSQDLRTYFDLVRGLHEKRRHGLSPEDARLSIEHWKDLAETYRKLNVDFGHEQEMESENEQAGEVISRSFGTVRSMLDKYVQEARRGGSVSIEQITQQVLDQIDEERDLTFGYYEKIDDAISILKSKSIKTLQEHDHDEQRARAKSFDTPRAIIAKRKEIEDELGHEGARVVHLTVDSPVDERLEGGAMDNYGPVRFDIDPAAVRGTTTFTVGDSLNANAVRYLFATSLDGMGGEYDRARRSVRNRQIIFEHIPLAKALMHIEGRRHGVVDGLFYIEAQVDDSANELHGAIREIAIQGGVNREETEPLIGLAQDQEIAVRPWA